MKENTEAIRFLGRRLKEIRAQRQCTQQTLARDLNTRQCIISYYETGKRCPRAEFLYEVARYFNVSMNYFFPIDSANEVEQREGIQALLMLSPKSLSFVTALMQTFSRNEYTRQRLVQNATLVNPEERFVLLLEQEMAYAIKDPVESLAGFMSIMLAIANVGDSNLPRKEELLQRLAARSHRLILLFRAMLKSQEGGVA